MHKRTPKSPLQMVQYLTQSQSSSPFPQTEQTMGPTLVPPQPNLTDTARRNKPQFAGLLPDHHGRFLDTLQGAC